MNLAFFHSERSDVHIPGTRVRQGKVRRQWNTLSLLLTAIAVLVGLILSYRLWLPLFARALSVEGKPRPVDVIVVLGGGSETRLKHGVELYNLGYAEKMILTGGQVKVAGSKETYAGLLGEEALHLGVPREAIILETRSTSTYEDALYTREIMARQRFDSAIIVTESYHARRAFQSFRKVFEGEGIELILSPSEPGWFEVDEWWTTEDGLLSVSNEYIKWAFYILHHGVSPF